MNILDLSPETLQKLFQLDEVVLAAKDFSVFIDTAKSIMSSVFGFKEIFFVYLMPDERKIRNVCTNRVCSITVAQLFEYNQVIIDDGCIFKSEGKLRSYLKTNTPYHVFFESDVVDGLNIDVFLIFINRITCGFNMFNQIAKADSYCIQLQLAYNVAKIGYWSYDLQNEKFSSSKEFKEMFLLPSNGKNEINLLKSIVNHHDILSFEGIFAEQFNFFEQNERIIHFNVDGIIKRTIFRYVSIFDADHLEIKRTGVVQDVTSEIDVNNQLERLESELFRAQRLESIGLFTSSITHDFNNILSSIQSNIELCIEDIDDSDLDQKDLLIEQLNAALYSTEFGTKITKRLLVFTRRDEPEVRFVNAYKLIQSMEDLLKFLIGKKIRFFLFSIPSLWDIYIDPSQFEQIILNLAINAKDSIRHSGDITLTTKNVTIDDVFIEKITNSSLLKDRNTSFKRGKYVQISISDTGCGIPLDDYEKIFDPFFTTKPPTKGTGMGLAIISRIVKKAEGYILFESQVNVGTTFHLYFPAYQPISNLYISSN
ncbi:hypothetical protein KJ940_12910 [Myxococcota bacterium]|nr:hypothetical protein [Myxococcota bacterium]